MAQAIVVLQLDVKAWQSEMERALINIDMVISDQYLGEVLGLDIPGFAARFSVDFCYGCLQTTRHFDKICYQCGHKAE